MPILPRYYRVDPRLGADMTIRNKDLNAAGRNRGPEHGECESTIARLRQELHALQAELTDARGGLRMLEESLRHQGCCDGSNTQP
jgi:hypothetical protein